jgi:hypothetical protein
MLTTFIGSFNDVAAAKEAALAEICPGADMLSQCRQSANAIAHPRP